MERKRDSLVVFGWDDSLLQMVAFDKLNSDLDGPREYVNVAGAVNGHWTACNGWEIVYQHQQRLQ